ncbi:GIY-YIG nuclease family protein [Candidatus Uhrbacteria bacterium]|nr:GIY-YIG nuclease family protein [Candidatus Uhrbacteria bacterium]
MHAERCFVYIATNASRTVLYIGIATNLHRRMWQHRYGLLDGFTKRYRVNRLTYAEEYTSAEAAARRERQLKGWTRARKYELVRSRNPGFQDLFPLFNM